MSMVRNIFNIFLSILRPKSHRSRLTHPLSASFLESLSLFITIVAHCLCAPCTVLIKIKINTFIDMVNMYSYAYFLQHVDKK